MIVATSDRPMGRADLHVHSWHSRVNGNLPFLRSRDCYSSPADVYRTATRRGMDVVTITDHDSIDGCLELLSLHPGATDILMAEEVSCRFPQADVEVHLGVYGMTEALHAAIQPLRRNVFDVIARLREADAFFALNHLLHFYRSEAPLEAYLQLLSAVPAIELRNGAMLRAHNELIADLCTSRVAPELPLAVVAGSDAHTLRRVGRTWTEAPGRTAAEFLVSLRHGLGRPGGAHGGAATIAGDAYGVVARYAASVFGWGPRDHSGWHRAACAMFVVGSLPFQFLPAAIAVAGKRREARTVAAAAERLSSSGRLTAVALEAGQRT
jgi:predicted metal-dependent phosphoesterase TrpH